MSFLSSSAMKIVLLKNAVKIILNMDDIRQEIPKKSPILYFYKRHYRQSLNKTFRTHVDKSMIFKTLKK